MAPSSVTKFCKIITSFAFQEGKLKLNTKFAHEHRKEFSHVARLSIPTGRCWDVRVQRDADGGIWLQDGISKFLKDNGVGILYFLVFEHEGSSKLLVHIYDLTATEILYNCSSGVSERLANELQIDATEGDGDDDDDEDDHLLPEVFPEPTSFASKEKLNKGVSRKATRAGQGLLTRKTGQCTARNGRSNASPAEMMRHLEPNSFWLPIRPYHIKKGIVRLPSAFSKAYMGSSTRLIKLVDSYNREWEVLYEHKSPSSYMLKKGWYGFARDNDLTRGDTCVFERIESDGDIKLKVKIQRDRINAPPAEKMRATIPNSFWILIQPHHLTTYALRLPNAFAEAHMCCSTQFIKLVDCYNKEWEVRYERNQIGHMLKTRWRVFMKEKGLTEGDICVFERVGSHEDVKLRVSIIKGDEMRTSNPSTSRRPAMTSSSESL